MSIITTMCDAIWNCFQSVYQGIKYLFGYQTDEGYQLIDSPNTTNSHGQTQSKSLSITPKILEEKSNLENLNENMLSNEIQINPLIIPSSDLNKYENQTITKKSSEECLEIDKTIEFQNQIQSETTTEFSEASKSIKIGEEKKFKNSDDDISNLNFYKTESEIIKSSHEPIKIQEKSEVTLIPQNITQVIAKTPEVSEEHHKSDDKFKNDHIEKLHKNLSEKISSNEQNTTMVPRSTSNKISNLAGKLGNINFVPPSSGIMARPLSLGKSSEEKFRKNESNSDNDDRNSSSSVNEMLKNRVKSANKNRRPPSRIFLEEQLRSNNRDNFNNFLSPENLSSSEENLDDQSQDEFNENENNSNDNLKFVQNYDKITNRDAQTESKNVNDSDYQKEKTDDSIETKNDQELQEKIDITKNPNPSLESLPKHKPQIYDNSYDASKSISIQNSVEDFKYIDNHANNDLKNNIKAVSSDFVSQDTESQNTSFKIPEDETQFSEFPSDVNILVNQPEFKRSKNITNADLKEDNFKTPFVTVTGEEFLSAEDFSKKES